VEKKVDV
jgi:hypothetical protein